MTGLKNEKPYLIHPLDSAEPYLQSVIGFDGVTPISIAPHGSFDELRANVTIEALHLDASDDGLRKERIALIAKIYWAKLALTNPLKNEFASKFVKDTLDKANNRFETHHNCTQCYLNLWTSDIVKAIEIGKSADKEYGYG